jgi:hypothetical protein
MHKPDQKDHIISFKDKLLLVREKTTPGDGDCGFRLFIDDDHPTPKKVRKWVFKVLFGLANQEKVRDDLGYEIEQALGIQQALSIEQRGEKFQLSQTLQEEWDSIASSYQNAKHEESVIRRSDSLKPLYSKDDRLLHTSEQLVSHLRDNNRKKEADALEHVLKTIKELQSNIFKFCRRQEVYAAYIASLRNKGWLGRKSAKCFAQALNYSFLLWDKQEEYQEVKWCFAEKDSFIAKNPSRTIYAAFMHGNHYNRLRLKSTLIFNTSQDEITPSEQIPTPASTQRHATTDPIRRRSITLPDNSRPQYFKLLAKPEFGDNDEIPNFLKSTLVRDRQASSHISEILQEEGNASYSIQNRDIEMLVWDTIKIGDDKYSHFIKFLINTFPVEKSKWIASLMPKAMEEVDKILRANYIHLEYLIQAEIYHKLNTLIETNSFESVGDYRDSLLSAIRELVEDAKQTFQERIGRIINQYCTNTEWPRPPEPLLKYYINKFKTYMTNEWPKNRKKFAESKFNIEQLEALDWVRELCNSQETHFWVSSRLSNEQSTRTGDEWSEFIVEKRNEITELHLKKKTQQAEELWVYREKEIPKALLRAWQPAWSGKELNCQEQKPAPLQSKEQYMKEQFQQWSAMIIKLGPESQAINPEMLIDAKTGSTLALVALKYDNKALYQFLQKECEISKEILQKVNKQGLCALDYERIYSSFSESALGDINQVERHDLVALEKGIRAYMDNWEQAKQIREGRKNTWNPISKLIDLLISNIESLTAPFEERMVKCEQVLRAIENAREGKSTEIFDQFLNKLAYLYNSSSDGPLSFFKEGRFRGLIGSFHQQHAQNSTALVKLNKEGQLPVSSLKSVDEDEKQRLKNENERLKLEKEALEQKAFCFEMEAKELQEKNKKLIIEKRFLERENRTVAKENKTLTEVNKIWTKENKTLTEENKTLTEENKTLTEINKTFMRENETLTQQVGALEIEISETNVRNQALREQISQLETKPDEDEDEDDPYHYGSFNAKRF